MINVEDFLEKKSKVIHKPLTMSLIEYLELAHKDKSLYSTAAERLLKAIGDPEYIDTRKDPRLRIIHGNRTIPKYKNFELELFGIETTIEKVVNFFKHAAQGLEEANQILYLYGPVGSAKSTIVEILKKLMEKEPIYILKFDDEISPLYESPVGLFNIEDSKKLNIPKRYLNVIPSPWAMKRLDSVKGDLTRFDVIKMYPDDLRQIAICKTEPGDENNQDISTLVGKTKLKALGKFSQSDPDGYDFSGALAKSNQGLLDFVEMLKSPLKTLHPLLTATQEHNYKGTEALAAIPYQGIIVAHSNEEEWDRFRSNKVNEAFLDRMYVVSVPYNLRVSDELKIYQKLLDHSELKTAPCAPETFKMLAKFACFSRVTCPEGTKVLSKLRVYDGQTIKKQDPKALTYQEYKERAGKLEGFQGISTRFAYKVLSKTFNYDHKEQAADPIVLLNCVLEPALKEEHLADDTEKAYINFIREALIPELFIKVERIIKNAYLEHNDEYGQNAFDRYLLMADLWEQDEDFRDPDTGQSYDHGNLERELEKIEIPAKITDPNQFRHEVVSFCLRYQAANKGKNPDWKSYEPLKKVIEANMFKATDEILPVISTRTHSTEDDRKKYKSFMNTMQGKGFTPTQIARLVEWYRQMKTNK